MATTLMISQGKCSDLILSSLVRARFGELIAPKVDHGQSDLFLMVLVFSDGRYFGCPHGSGGRRPGFRSQTRSCWARRWEARHG